jgi:hypothetical protein
METHSSQTQPETPIDVWYLAQDREVEEMLKTLERNRRRRQKLDQDELQRRVDKRVRQLEEDFAENLAIARAIYRLTSSDDKIYGMVLVMREKVDEFWNEAYQRRYPGRDIDSHCPAWDSAQTIGAFGRCDDRVRCEVEKEMREELEARKAAREAARRKRQEEA